METGFPKRSRPIEHLEPRSIQLEAIALSLEQHNQGRAFPNHAAIPFTGMNPLPRQRFGLM